ncbi:MAG TPA: serine--tRNA ligase [Actinomycetota bacterium]|nr:serine--tRNA ligase [Actinomycetota bacterium]
MIDLKLLRDDLDFVRAAYARRGGVPQLDEVAELDRKRRRMLVEVENARAEQNRLSRLIPLSAPEDRPSAIAEAKVIADRLKELEPELERTEEELTRLASYLPNLPDESVPSGLSEEENVVAREVGERPRFDFEPLDHATLGRNLGIFDAERGVKTSGSRFVYLTGPGAVLELSLVRFAIDMLGGRGFTPVITPVLVRERAMYGTGFLPADEREIYKIERDDLYLAGTSEVALASMHAEETVDGARLPLRYAGFSTNFRREAGTYGKDTQGLVRLHQFDKVEQFSYSHPDTSWDEYDFILANQEEFLQALEIPYRVVVMCGGDLGPMAAKKIDHEAWLPASDRFLEVTSATNATDYQARRFQTRFRAEGKSGLVHTLNGTACAVGRTIVALLENHQRADGSVAIPEPLRHYTGFESLQPIS